MGKWVLYACAAFAGLNAWSVTVNFANLSNCNSNFYADSRCKLFSGQFGEWTEADRKAVAADFAAALKLPKFKRLLQILGDKGMNDIQFVRMEDEGDIAASTPDMNVYYIALYPGYFQTALKFGSVSERTHALVHELFHAYDSLMIGSNYFSTPAWVSLGRALEWRYAASLNPLIDSKSRLAANKLRNQLAKQGHLTEAIATDLSYSRPLGFPSIYSMSAMNEYFAELGSFLAHDPSLQKALPAAVVEWLRSMDLAFLLDGPASPAPKAPKENGEFDFVGLLFLENQPLCTVFLKEHGLAVTAKHCIQPAWAGKSGPGFLTLEFRTAEGKRVLVSGFQIQNVTRDPGDNDVAAITYDPSMTKGQVNIPVLHFHSVTDYSRATQLMLVSYPMPERVQELHRIESPACHWDGGLRRLDGYEGPLYATDCRAWYGSSGGPILSRIPGRPGEFDVWGTLTHTFHPSDLHSDDWGSYTDSNFSPLYLSVVLGI